MKWHIRQLMISMKRTTSHPPSDLNTGSIIDSEEQNDPQPAMWALFDTDAANDSFDTSAANDKSLECVFDDTMSYMAEEVADDNSEDPFNNCCSEQVAKALHPKSDGETGESAQQPSRGLIYLMSSQDQIKIGSCTDSSLDTLPDMTNSADRYRNKFTFLFVTVSIFITVYYISSGRHFVMHVGDITKVNARSMLVQIASFRSLSSSL